MKWDKIGRGLKGWKDMLRYVCVNRQSKAEGDREGKRREALRLSLRSKVSH